MGVLVGVVMRRMSRKFWRCGVFRPGRIDSVRVSTGVWLGTRSVDQVFQVRLDSYDTSAG